MNLLGVRRTPVKDLGILGLGRPGGQGGRALPGVVNDRVGTNPDVWVSSLGDPLTILC